MPRTRPDSRSAFIGALCVAVAFGLDFFFFFLSVSVASGAAFLDFDFFDFFFGLSGDFPAFSLFADGVVGLLGVVTGILVPPPSPLNDAQMRTLPNRSG